MNIVDISKQLPAAGSNGIRKLSEIRFAVVHHEGVLAADVYDHVSRYKTEANFHINKGWKRLGYHFKVARNGSVYQTNPLEEIAFHAGNSTLIRSSFGICVDGDFTKQQPSGAQYDALRELLDELTTRRPDIPWLLRTSIRYHREVRFPPWSTACPGPPLIEFVKGYRT